MAGSLTLFAVMSTWLTPIWLIGVGAAGGLLVLLAIYGILAAVSRRAAAFIRMTVREGILFPLLLTVTVLAAFSVLVTPVVPYRSLLDAVSRLPVVGAVREEVTVPKVTSGFEIPLFFRSQELQGFSLVSDEPLTVFTYVTKGAG